MDNIFSSFGVVRYPSFLLNTIPASSESVCVVIAIITYTLKTMSALIELQGKLLGCFNLCVVKDRLA